MKVEHTCKILAKEVLGSGAVAMTLGVGDMVRTDRMGPGKFIHIQCGGASLLRRPISVCAWSVGRERDDTLTVVFETRGEGTAWLARRPVGHMLDVLGPLGNGFDVELGTYLLVGGGIGVPPMLSCAGYTGGTSTAILGFRSRDKAILLDEFAGECAQVQIATDDGSLGHHGFVDELVRRELEKQSYRAVLACGPRPMLKSVARAAAAFGVPCQVSMEERMGCGVGACLVCATPMRDGTVKHVCKDGPVFRAEEVDWDA
ncbi:MAG: dihydroorotate dehydrogenase electron transfer subunit [Lawsonibacter sp.]|nr:dihydroorotate dehydrogenase electron transfer subunit [Lawsonibacter sp.]